MMTFIDLRLNKARAAWLLSLFCFLVVSCEQAPKHETVAFSGSTMGTTYNIKLIVKPEQRQAAKATQVAIDSLLKEFNQSLSSYIKDSEIMTINAAPTQQWLPVSMRFLKVLKLSQEISALSEGAFDVTVAPLVNLWGFGPEWQKDQVPSEQAIAKALAVVDYTAIGIDEQGGRIQKLKPVQLDFSAIAKGYGVDELATYLWQQGFHHFMVEIGGELRLHGHNAQGKPWRIGVESPQASGKIKPVSLSEVGMATSGDYRNYFEQNGVRFSHTIDPSTGHPITHNLASATVVASTAAKADALATAFSVMGGDKAMALAKREGIAVYLIERKGEAFVARYSPAFSPYLQEP
ncbi:MAG TPA: FAD:protein FMN transferase [Marinagarivorans sp.]